MLLTLLWLDCLITPLQLMSPSSLIANFHYHNRRIPCRVSDRSAELHQASNKSDLVHWPPRRPPPDGSREKPDLPITGKPFSHTFFILAFAAGTSHSMLAPYT